LITARLAYNAANRPLHRKPRSKFATKSEPNLPRTGPKICRPLFGVLDRPLKLMGTPVLERNGGHPRAERRGAAAINSNIYTPPQAPTMPRVRVTSDCLLVIRHAHRPQRLQLDIRTGSIISHGLEEFHPVLHSNGPFTPPHELQAEHKPPQFRCSQ